MLSSDMQRNFTGQARSAEMAAQDTGWHEDIMEEKGERKVCLREVCGLFGRWTSQAQLWDLPCVVPLRISSRRDTQWRATPMLLVLPHWLPPMKRTSCHIAP